MRERREPSDTCGRWRIKGDLVRSEWGIAHPQSPRSFPCTGGADVLMEACCGDGHRMATQYKDCSLPYISDSKECRYVCQWPPWDQDGVPQEKAWGGRDSVCQTPREVGYRSAQAVGGAVGRRPRPPSSVLPLSPEGTRLTHPVLSSDCPGVCPLCWAASPKIWECSSLCTAGHSGQVSFLVRKSG